MATHISSTFTLAATGDAIITRRLLPAEGVASAFDDLLGLLRDADVSVTNFEVIAHEYEGYPSTECGGTYMRAPPSVIDELVGMGCDLFSAATNHAFDYGHRDIERTLEARNHDPEGALTSDRANPECWITVVPVCTFDTVDGSVEIELHPVTLQQDLPRSQCGTPVSATSEMAHDILERVADRSEPFRTTIEIDDGIGIVRHSEAAQ